MKGSFLLSSLNLIVAYMAVVFLFGQTANAACLENGARKTLYVHLKGKAGAIERNLPVGDLICLNESEGGKIVANIQPFGGARFGCRFEYTGGDNYVITEFNTMNNCSFLKLTK